jgi:hypothetical protein
MEKLIAGIGPVFGFSLATSKQEFDAILQQLDLGAPYTEPWIGDAAAATTHSVPFGGGNTRVIVCLDPSRGKPADLLSAVVHEAAHVFQKAAALYGLAPCDEVMAYGIQNVTDAILCRLEESGHLAFSKPPADGGGGLTAQPSVLASRRLRSARKRDGPDRSGRRSTR